ncbi:MAG: flagellar hook capping FlgD N-terminal domain-containing protein [Motilibacteraceae bacterium]
MTSPTPIPTAPVSTVASALSGPQSSASSASSADNSAMGKDVFLKLLVAQMKYQDPMNPVQGSEFIAQTAQLNSVEKLDDISKAMTEMVAGQNLLGTSSLIGKTVDYTATDGSTKTGTVASVRLGTAGASLHVLPVGAPAGATGDDVTVGSVTEVRNS